MVGKTTITEANGTIILKRRPGQALTLFAGMPWRLPEASDSAAIQIIQNALPFAQKYGIELHAWIWTLNRTEHALRAAHPTGTR